jgi:hypothetical protein
LRGWYQCRKKASISSRSRTSTVSRLPSTSRPERVAGEDRLGQQGVDVVLGHVQAHQDLFEDHLALGVDLVGPEGRLGEDVAQDVEAHVDPVGGQPGVVRGVLPGGEGVHLAAHHVDRLGDLAGDCAGGALEQQVLEEVRRPGQLGGLVAPADADPGPERDRAASASARSRLGCRSTAVSPDLLRRSAGARDPPVVQGSRQLSADAPRRRSSRHRRATRWAALAAAASPGPSRPCRRRARRRTPRRS